MKDIALSVAADYPLVSAHDIESVLMLASLENQSLSLNTLRRIAVGYAALESDLIEHLEPRQPVYDRTCTCGFTLSLPFYERTCPTRCQIRRTNASDAMSKARHKRRQGKVNPRNQPYSRSTIVKRDRSTCQLCFMPILLERSWPDPLSLAIDHIRPINHGGADNPRNVRATHQKCNNWRSDSMRWRISAEQQEKIKILLENVYTFRA